MIRGLTQVPWERVDVSFQKSRQRYIAHSTIQVKFLSSSFPQTLLTLFLLVTIVSTTLEPQQPQSDMERAFVIKEENLYPVVQDIM